MRTPVSHLFRRNILRVLQRGRAENVNDEVQLVHVVATGKQRFSSEQLGHDASDRPHVDWHAYINMDQKEARHTRVTKVTSLEIQQHNGRKRRANARTLVRVLLPAEHDLGSAIPTRGDIFSHKALVRLVRVGAARKSKVANLEVAIAIQ